MNKRLTKSSDNVVISGVLGGIAEYLGVDATIVRVIYVFLSMISAAFPGITLYIILMVLMPSDSNARNRDPRGSYKNFGGKPQRKEAEKVDDDDWSDF